jgi:RNA polymerase sigma-70 factor, ECF subfamily
MHDEFMTLLDQARTGDQLARGAIFQACRNYLLHVANSDFDDRLRAKCAPSDIVQNTMLCASEGFQDFRGESEVSLRAWLREILKNEMAQTSRRYLGTSKRNVLLESRSPRVRAGGTPQQEESARAVDPFLTPASEAVINEEAQTLRNAMLKLPELYRQILVWRNWERLEFREIGARLDKSENAVKKIWARALTRLQTTLQPQNARD